MFTNAGRLFLRIEQLVDRDVCVFSELNLRIWQQSKKMFEQSGKRPVVYNNKCGQMCGVSVRLHCFLLSHFLLF